MATTRSSPPSAHRASLISELAADLRRSHEEFIGSSPRHARQPSILEMLEATETQTSFTPSQDGLVSTQAHIELDETTEIFPQIRSTARARRFALPRPESHINVDTSMVEREFQDFDHNNEDSSVSRSIELGRGSKSKLNQSSIMSPDHFLSMGGHDSLYDMSGTPGSKSRVRRSDNNGRIGSLRRDAQQRAGSLANNQNDGAGSYSTKSPRQTPSKTALGGERRRTTLAEMHAKVTSEAESSLLEEHPPTVTISSKNTRFNPRARQASANATVPTKFTPGKGLDNSRIVSTPQRVFGGTPRAINGTVNSFALPDLPNLTELVSGQYKDGTPIFSRSTPARSRFASEKKQGYGEDPKKFDIVGEIPLPIEEKAILASLQLLQEKVTQLEHEKADAENKAEELETEVIELQAELQAKEHARRPDSGLGSDGEDSKGKWRVEKTRLELNVQSLQGRLDRAERKATTSDIAFKRVNLERDNAVTQLGVAFMEQEELKTENENLRAENDALRKEVHILRSQGDQLQNQMAETETRHQNDTLRWAAEKAEIQQRASRPDRAAQAELRRLREDLAQAKAKKDEETQRFNVEKAQLKKQAVDEVRSEYKKLKAENSKLQSQLEQAEAAHEEQIRKERARAELFKGRFQRREASAPQTEALPQMGANEAMKQQNEKLRAKLTAVQKKLEEKEEELKDVTMNLDELLGANSVHGVDGTESRFTRDNHASTVRSVTQSKRRAIDPTAGRPSIVPRTRVDNDESDSESTTHLTLTPPFQALRGTSGNIQRSAMKTSVLPPIEAPTMNDTYLSLMEPDLVNNLRKRVEEMHLAERRRKSAPQEKADTVRTMFSEGGNHTRTTFNELTGYELYGDGNKENQDTVASKHARAASGTYREDTKQSLLSNTGRRRRTAPAVEMTSAFILPDITLRNATTKPAQSGHGRNTVLHTIAPHDAKQCTVCARTVSKASGVEISANIPTPIPVNSRGDSNDDIDATMRPSQPPKVALASVIKQLQDEVEHIQLELAAEEDKLRTHDTSKGRRARRAIEARIIELTELHQVKADMVYSLFDVLEGQAGESANNMTEAVEETLRSVGFDIDEIRRGDKRAAPKRVIIEDGDVTMTDDGSFGGFGEETEELPWEGF